MLLRNDGTEKYLRINNAVTTNIYHGGTYLLAMFTGTKKNLQDSNVIYIGKKYKAAQKNRS